MSPKFYYIVTSQASVLLPVLAGIVSYKKLTPSFRLLFYFFVLCIGFEIQSTLCKAILHNNQPGLHLYTLVEFLVFSTVYYYHFQKNSILQLFIGINAIVFVAVCIADAFFINNIWSPNPLSRSYSSISMILYTLVYFYFMFRKDATQYNLYHPMFWVNIGALIYFGSSTLYFMIGFMLLKRSDIAAPSVLYHGMMNIIANCLYAQSFRCFRTQKAVS